MGGAVPAGRIREGGLAVGILLWNFGQTARNIPFPCAPLRPSPPRNGESNTGVVPLPARREDSA